MEKEVLRRIPVLALSPEEFERLLPLACAWAKEQERLIITRGVELSEIQMADAQRIGIASPERVRLMKTERIPLPQRPELRSVAQEAKIITPATAGLTLGYGIVIHSFAWGERKLVVHELVHVRQYEQLGGIDAFLRRYLGECVTGGYPQAPMEQEAHRRRDLFLSPAIT
jgi:hypothetical protein